MSAETFKSLEDNSKIELEKNSLEDKEMLDLKKQFQKEEKTLAENMSKTKFSIENKNGDKETPTLHDILVAIDNERLINWDNYVKTTPDGNISFSINGKSFNLGWKSELWGAIQSFLVAAGYGNKLGKASIDGRVGSGTMQAIRDYIVNKKFDEDKTNKSEKGTNLPEKLTALDVNTIINFMKRHVFEKRNASDKVFDFTKAQNIIWFDGTLNIQAYPWTKVQIDWAKKVLKYTVTTKLMNKTYEVPLKDIIIDGTTLQIRKDFEDFMVGKFTESFNESNKIEELDKLQDKVIAMIKGTDFSPFKKNLNYTYGYGLTLVDFLTDKDIIDDGKWDEKIIKKDWKLVFKLPDNKELSLDPKVLDKGWAATLLDGLFGLYKEEIKAAVEARGLEKFEVVEKADEDQITKIEKQSNKTMTFKEQGTFFKERNTFVKQFKTLDHKRSYENKGKKNEYEAFTKRLQEVYKLINYAGTVIEKI